MNCGVQIAPVASVPPPPPEPISPPTPMPTPSASPGPASPSGDPAGACPSCGYSVAAAEQFCDNCGVQLSHESSVPAASAHAPDAGQSAAPAVVPSPSSICANCGSQLSPEEQFCNTCGLQAAVDDTPIPAPLPSEGVPQAIPAAYPPSSDAPGEGYITGKLIIKATQAEIMLPAGKTEMLIGRSDPVRNIFPDIDLTIHGGDSSGVSRRHSRLTLQDTHIYLEDLNSTNYTFLNKQRLQPGQRYPINHGDEIRLGLLTLEYLTS